jgi:hypothetical protein
MRIWWTIFCLGALALPLGAGCGDTADVMVTFAGSSAMPDVGSGFVASRGTATVDATQGTLDLHAENTTAVLDISLDTPTLPGPVMLGERHLQVSYSLGSGATSPGWALNGGSVTFQTLDPYKVTFDNLEMVHATPGATGTFTLSGSGTFTK